MALLYGFFVLTLWCSAQPCEHGWIDTVYAFRPGTGQDFGREFFPHNIFGPPDTAARVDRPSANPHQILSLGMGGEIIVGFRGKVILNGAGPDFVVFENAFRTPRGKIFAEPALVSVSSDGVNWQTFPWDSLTLRGCAGVSPTNGSASDFLDPAQSGGDWFDLAELQLDTVRYIRISDLTWWLVQHPEHPFWDPTLSGFDLDAVGSRCLCPDPALSAPQIPSRRQLLLSDPCMPSLSLKSTPGDTYQLFTLEGRCIGSGTLQDWLCVPVHATPLLVHIRHQTDSQWWLIVWL